MVFGWLFFGCYNENCRNYVYVLVLVGDIDLWFRIILGSEKIDNLNIIKFEIYYKWFIFIM